MRVLSDLSGLIHVLSTVRYRVSAGRESRARRLALRPRVTPLRVIHPDEIDFVSSDQGLDRAS